MPTDLYALPRYDRGFPNSPHARAGHISVPLTDSRDGYIKTARNFTALSSCSEIDRINGIKSETNFQVKAQHFAYSVGGNNRKTEKIT